MTFLNWSGIPVLAAVALLICAFASVARHSHRSVSGLWLTGWLMILLHFVAALFYTVPGIWGALAFTIASASLGWAGVMYIYASIAHHKYVSSPWMLGSVAAAGTLYVTVLCLGSTLHWALNLAALLLGICPLVVMLASMRKDSYPLRWVIVTLIGSLSIFLLIFQNRPGIGQNLAWNSVMFSIYLGCCIVVSYEYRRATAGAFVTIAGFFFWASVFVVAPLIGTLLPHVHVESEVWNLPKFVVAVGMMLLLLEDQIEYNKHLALHDMLTGLPNRRLFEDRIAFALERSRRSGAEMALLVIDLNGFKQVNDTMGHHVGDLLLQRVASIFAERVRRSDTVSRTGGDEFSVILEEPTNREDAERVGRSLRELLDEPLDLGQHTVRISASVGVAVYPEDADDAELLCIAADLRMYEAKNYALRSCPNPASTQWKSQPDQNSVITNQLGLV
ncbi:MAG: GGDEF domain-containing protein [Terracidiphilus sp.]|jgi:diguanylate cyclase (GGDEF)-like protein